MDRLEEGSYAFALLDFMDMYLAVRRNVFGVRKILAKEEEHAIYYVTTDFTFWAGSLQNIDIS